METKEATLEFRKRDFKGSRLRCLLLTSNKPNCVASFLNDLVAPYASVTSADHWAPRGFLEAKEARLGETPDFLSEPERTELTQWWLAQPGRANTPNWDLVSTCRINDRVGLLLIEAKAHEGELADDACTAKNVANLQRIKSALAQAAAAWNTLSKGFVFSVDSHYQFSNRFAFAWKIASMGRPVVLLYLGFLKAGEMSRGRVLLQDHAQWRRCVIAGSEGIIPEEAWGRTFHVRGTPLTVLIGAATVSIHADSIGDTPMSTRSLSD